MKTAIRIFGSVGACIAIALLFTMNACKETEFSEDYDIDWPIPTITSFSPAQATIESEVTITGTNLEKTNRVTIGNAEAEIISQTGTQIIVRVPRQATNDNIRLTTLYKREATSNEKFVPEYPKTTVTGWPPKIVRGRTFKITGENVDLITSVMVGTATIPVDGSKGTATEITISVAGVDLSAVDNVVIKIKSTKGGMDGLSDSPPIPVEDPTDIFEPQPAIVLFDFENAQNTFVPAGSLSPTAAIDGAGVAKARGQHYLSVTANNVTSWQDIGYIEIAEAVDLSDFTEPHISFLVNTNGNAGYFQLEDGQGNWYHFLKSPDSYMFQTTGWEWRSYNLKEVDDGRAFDLANVKAKLMFKTGNVNNADFEISIDQVMFTDGPVAIKHVLFNFESGGSPYSGTATSAINNGGAIPSIEGAKYLTVTKANVGKWDWTGEMTSNQAINLGELTDPHISFWINTGSNYGNLQIEVTQAGTKWGSDPFAKEQNDLGGYAVKTDGQWKLYTFRMSELLISKWGGDGTAFDPAGTIDYLKFGLSTGNIENSTYEVNIDQVVISSGPIF